MAIPGFGKAGQSKLKAANVAIVGLGGLGSSASTSLAMAGVGHITLIDSERVELSNLNRQSLHWEADIGQLKVKSASRKLREINSTIHIREKCSKVTSKNVKELIKGAHVVVDCTDNYQTRYLLNKACVQNRIPLVHGAVEGMIGQLMTIMPGVGPCLKCVIPKEPPKKHVIPVLGGVPGVIGCLQAIEAIKLITGIGKPLVGRMLIFNGADMTFDEIKVDKDPRCPICGKMQR